MLLFPPWKFDIRGPSALLDLMSQYGRLCVIAAVDAEVFWELLAQLLADPVVRPPDRIFTQAVIAEVFGKVAQTLNALPVGQGMVLSDQVELRKEIPRVLETRDSPRPEGELSLSEKSPPSPRYRFRYAEVRRGALFPTVPAGRTARMFPTMTEEAAPWFLILVPEEILAT